MRHLEIHGIVMRPCSETHEQNGEVMNSTKYSTSSDFLNNYNNHIAAMEIVAECAKSYIEKNWQVINDWTNLDVIILDNTGKTIEYYNYKPIKNRLSKIGSPFNSLLSSVDVRNKEKHNPVTSLTDVVLDTTDGDFSLTINNHNHLWIDDESVIIIADYIENKLKDEENNSHK